jgi:hypothetical protein
MHADVAEPGCPEQGIANRVQEDIAVRMRQHAAIVRNAHSSEGDVIPIGERVHIVAVANANL